MAFTGTCAFPFIGFVATSTFKSSLHAIFSWRELTEVVPLVRAKKEVEIESPKIHLTSSIGEIRIKVELQKRAEKQQKK